MTHSQLHQTKSIQTSCPRIIKTIRSTQENAWYQNWIGEEYTVIECVKDYYLVHTWNGLGEMIPSLILKKDCKTVVL